MTQIAAGTGINNRIGENVRIVSWQVNLKGNWLGSIQSSINDSPSYRFYICQDMQQVASTTPSGIDLVDQPSLPGTQLLQVTEQKRFKVLFDSKPQIAQQGVVTAVTLNSGPLPQFRHMFNVIRKCNIPVEFNGTVASNIQKNGLYLFVFTDMTTGAGDCFDFTCTTRVGFTDV
jgi:hypothetical protein